MCLQNSNKSGKHIHWAVAVISWIDCVSLQAVYLKANQTLSIVVGDEVQYQFGTTIGCASLYDVGGTGQNGEVIVQVSGCGDSRCSV